MVKNLPAMQGDLGSIPELGRFPGGGNGNPLQCSCLENPMNRGTWQATVHGVTEPDMTEVTQNALVDIFLVGTGSRDRIL